jgi:hypothetical protein
MRILNVWLAVDNRKTKRFELKKFTPKVVFRVHVCVRDQLMIRSFKGAWDETDL